MVAGIAATYRAFNYIEDLRAGLTKASGSGAPAEVQSAARAIDSAVNTLASGPDGFGAAHRDLGRRLNDMLVGDVEPTPSVTAGVDRPCAAIDVGLERLRALQATGIAELNATLARANRASLPTWAPPAGPACGGK